MTKNEMAKVIIQALYNMPTPPKSDHWHVKRTANQKKEIVIDHYKLACKILEQRN